MPYIMKGPTFNMKSQTLNSTCTSLTMTNIIFVLQFLAKKEIVSIQLPLAFQNYHLRHPDFM